MNIPMELKKLYTKNEKGRKLPFKKSWLKIIFEMEITIFNQRMFFEVVNVTTKIVPPLEEPEGRFVVFMILWK